MAEMSASWGAVLCARIISPGMSLVQRGGHEERMGRELGISCLVFAVLRAAIRKTIQWIQTLDVQGISCFRLETPNLMSEPIQS